MVRLALVGLALWNFHAAPAPAPAARARVHYEKGMELVRDGDPEGGEAELEGAVALDPTWPDALYGLAIAQAMSGRNVEAAASFRTFLRRFPQDPRVPSIREAVRNDPAQSGDVSEPVPASRKRGKPKAVHGQGAKPTSDAVPEGNAGASEPSATPPERKH